MYTKGGLVLALLVQIFGARSCLAAAGSGAEGGRVI